MKLKLYNPYIGNEIVVEESEAYYESELQRVYDKEVDFIMLTDANTNKTITLRPSNWAMIEVEE